MPVRPILGQYSSPSAGQWNKLSASRDAPVGQAWGGCSRSEMHGTWMNNRAVRPRHVYKLQTSSAQLQGLRLILSVLPASPSGPGGNPTTLLWPHLLWPLNWWLCPGSDYSSFPSHLRLFQPRLAVSTDIRVIKALPVSQECPRIRANEQEGRSQIPPG